MRHDRLLAAVVTLVPLICVAAPLDLTEVHVVKGATPVTLRISISGALPTGSDLRDYTNKDNWQVFWRHDTASVPASPNIASVDLDTTSFHLMIRLGSDNLPGADSQQVMWTVLFKPPATMAAVPVVIASVESAPAVHTSTRPFTPTDPGGVPDILVTGSFLAGGNTKPIYTLQEKAGIYGPKSWDVWGWRPGITSEIDANQSAQSVTNRSRLDPDSFTVALSWLRVKSIQSHGIYGLSTQIDLPKGEFARYGPASDIVAGFVTTIVPNKPGKIGDHAFLKFYPVLGLEAGRNLNRPNALMDAPIDLSHYGAIFRGVTGVDAAFGVTSTGLSMLASYRVRLPAEDEPFVYISHGQTFAYNTDKARHSLSANITWVPRSLPYFGVTANYLWGSLPPIFSFVDHQVTLGLSVQATQKNKPTITAH